MLDIRPDLAALTRASYARELRGDLRGAVVAMTQAVTAGSGGGGGENLAYAYVLLGDLLVTTGDLDQAAQAYDSAESAFSDFPAAKAGRARLLVAQGRNEEAADLLQDVLDVQPLSQYAIARGDALSAAGRDDDAEEAYALVDAIARLEQENGVSLDLELALFKADHDPGPNAVKLARTALKARPSIYGHDALAWNLLRAGDAPAASDAMADALVTGSHDPVIRFHAAVIADENGDRSGATKHLQSVLDTNPRFSAAFADDVKTLAGKLGLTVPAPAPT